MNNEATMEITPSLCYFLAKTCILALAQTHFDADRPHLLRCHRLAAPGKGWEDNTEKSIMPAKGIPPVLCSSRIGVCKRVFADAFSLDLVPDLFLIRSLAASTRSQPC
jgi:hypothetical protein